MVSPRPSRRRASAEQIIYLTLHLASPLTPHSVSRQNLKPAMAWQASPPPLGRRPPLASPSVPRHRSVRSHRRKPWFPSAPEATGRARVAGLLLLPLLPPRPSSRSSARSSSPRQRPAWPGPQSTSRSRVVQIWEGRTQAPDTKPVHNRRPECPLIHLWQSRSNPGGSTSAFAAAAAARRQPKR